MHCIKEHVRRRRATQENCAPLASHLKQATQQSSHAGRWRQATNATTYRSKASAKRQYLTLSTADASPPYASCCCPAPFHRGLR